MILFLYSQDLSNCKTMRTSLRLNTSFLYSQDLSNCKTLPYSLNATLTRFCTLKI